MDATHIEAAVRPRSVPQVLRELTKNLRKEIYKHAYELSGKFPEKPSLEADISEEIKKIYQRIKDLLDTDQIRKIRSKDDEDARFGHKTPKNL